MNDAASSNLFRHINELWIGPEIEKRKLEGTLPEDFKIQRCLIKLPTAEKPIVLFNDEIGWLAIVKKPLGIAFKKGDPIYLHQIEKIDTVSRPYRVRSFVLTFRNGSAMFAP